MIRYHFRLTLFGVTVFDLRWLRVEVVPMSSFHLNETAEYQTLENQ